jgi:hypothetical protein
MAVTLEWEDFKESLGKIKMNYREFIFGIIVGLAFGVLATLIILDFLTFLVLANLVLTAIILLSMKKTNVPMVTYRNPTSKRKVCPECGSPARHRKGCSRSKEKK